MGAQTVGMLLAARLTDPNDANARDVNLIEPRISVGVLLAATSHGSDDQSVFGRANYSGLNPDFTQMTTQTRVVMDDAEVKAGSKPGFAWLYAGASCRSGHPGGSVSEFSVNPG